MVLHLIPINANLYQKFKNQRISFFALKPRETMYSTRQSLSGNMKWELWEQVSSVTRYFWKQNKQIGYIFTKEKKHWCR